jgi:hypothetical protein
MIPSRIVPDCGQEEVRDDVVQKLRALAAGGGTVRDLVGLLRTELGIKEDALLPVLWYFMKAFTLPLGDVLPIREWLGTGDDEAVNAAVLPAIRKAMGRVGYVVRAESRTAREGEASAPPARAR